MKKGHVFFLMVIFLMVVSFLVCYFVNNIIQITVYRIFGICISIFFLCLFWKYIKRILKKEKNRFVNNLWIILGIVLFVNCDLVCRLLGEYYIFAYPRNLTNQDALSYVITELHLVYSYNIWLVLKITINEIIVCLFAIFDLSKYILPAWKNLMNLMFHDDTEDAGITIEYSDNDGLIEKGYLVFPEKYRFAEGKKVVADVLNKNQLRIYSEDLIKCFFEEIKTNEDEECVTICAEKMEKFIDIEIHNDRIPIETLRQTELNLNANRIKVESFGDYYIIDFIE